MRSLILEFAIPEHSKLREKREESETCMKFKRFGLRHKNKTKERQRDRSHTFWSPTHHSTGKKSQAPG